MRDRDHQGYASSGAFDLPKMSRAAKVKCVGRISIAELQARNGTRHKKGKGRFPKHVLRNEVERWAKHKGVEVTKRCNYISINLS